MLSSGIKPVFAQSTFVIVSGVSGDCSYLNGTYNYVDTVNGRSRYNFDGTHNIYWTNTQWIIDNPFAEVLYFSSDNVSEPYNVSTWVGSYCTGAFGSVYQGFQPTTTPTFHPLFPTSTPPAPGDYTCPGYQPIGAGTVTPAADWLLKCAQCITPIPRYTWPTAPAMSTPNWEFQATPTPTQSAANFEWLENYKADYWVNASPYTRTALLPEISYSDNRSNNIAILTTFQQKVANSPITGYVIGIHDWGSYHIISNGGGYVGIQMALIYGNVYIDVDVLESNMASFPVGRLITNAAPGTYRTLISFLRVYNYEFEKSGSYDITYNVTVRVGPGNGFTNHFEEMFESESSNYSLWNFNTNRSYKIGGYSIIPIPTPIASDCSTITDVDPLDPNDPNFKLPYVSVGDGVGTTVGGWTISTSWLQVFFPNAPDSITFPGIEFIFAPIEFGSLNLFGISIDLDFMAMAMAGVLMFKVITR